MNLFNVENLLLIKMKKKNVPKDGSATVIFRCLPLQVHVSFGHSVDGKGIWWPRSGYNKKKSFNATSTE